MSGQNCSLMPSPSAVLGTVQNALAEQADVCNLMCHLVLVNLFATITTDPLPFWTWWRFQKRSIHQNPWRTASCNNVPWKHTWFLWTDYHWSSNDWKWTGWQVWQRCHSYVWYQFPSYKSIRETRLSMLRRNILIMNYLFALLDHNLWIPMCLPTLLCTASWCTTKINFWIMLMLCLSES